MFTRALAALAGIGFVLTIGVPSVAGDTGGPTALCTGDPELPDVQFLCQQVSVRLAADAEIELVVARSAPSATIVGLESTGTWHLRVPPGQEATVRDALREDPAVDYVSLWYVGDLSGAGGLPDTAMTPSGLRLTAIVGFLMVAAVLAAASSRPADAHEGTQSHLLREDVRNPDAGTDDSSN
jgi:hypothetical protein